MIRKQYTIPSDRPVILASNTFLTQDIKGKQVIAVYKDGIGCTKIIPTNLPYSFVISGIAKNNCWVNYEAGYIAVASRFEKGESFVILFQDISDFCAAPTLQSAFEIPDANAMLEYNASFTLVGTAPFNVSSVTAPSWLNVSVSDNFLMLSGTPGLIDVVSGAQVSVTINNNCGTNTYTGSINVIVEDTFFARTRAPIGTRTHSIYILNINGTPGVIVAIKLIDLINNNGGTLYVNGIGAAINDTWIVTIDATGAAILDVDIRGNVIQGTSIYAKFVIDSVNSGSIGVPNFVEIKKFF